jgi:hypothetical protein
MELLSGFGKRGVELGLLTKQADIEDTEFLSKYFVLQEFSPKLTAGKNSITFNGSGYLKQGSEVLVECLDSSGLPLYIESTTKTSIAYKEASAYILAIHVYVESSNGPGKLVLYGTTTTGATVRWIGNIIVDKTLQNSSPVRFYTKPTLEVSSILSPVLSVVGELNKEVELSGSFYSYAVTPEKDSLQINKRNVDIDYRIFNKTLDTSLDPSASFNTQIIGSNINLNVTTIQEPYSYKNINVNFTSSIKIKDVINNSTLILSDVISYSDSKKNDVVTNVVDGTFYLKYPYITYNTASDSSSYLKVPTENGDVEIKSSYADITYRNLRTFSGFIARHKLYRKSLFSPGDFEIIADEPLQPYELVQDKLTTNKSFNSIGKFYNQLHVNKYVFSGSNNIQLIQSSDRLIEGLIINSVNSNDSLNSLSNYIIFKDDSSKIGRDSTYYPYDSVEFLSLSGSSYDSNFIALKKDVSYILSVNAILKKDGTTLADSDAGIEFYFTSSSPESNLEQASVVEQNGLIKLGTIPIYESVSEKVYHDPVKTLFSVSRDLYGTLVIVPRKCTAIISQLSIKPYGDSGFSPDTLITRIPFPINIANESFEIKAELFDINSNLVYSDLRTVSSFDPAGASLFLYIPGLKDPSKTTFISGSLEISQSLWVGENATITGSLTVGGSVFFPGITECNFPNKRFLAWNPESPFEGKVCTTSVNDITGSVDKSEVIITNFEGGFLPANLYNYRLIPSIEGKNIYVEPKTVSEPIPISLI